MDVVAPKVDEITRTVAGNLALARKLHKLTQPKMANLVGIGGDTIRAWEACRAKADTQKIVELAEILKLEGGWLWFYQDHKSEDLGAHLASNAVAHRESGIRIPAEYRENREELEYLTVLKASGKPMKPEEEARYEDLLLRLRYFYFHESQAPAPSASVPLSPEYNPVGPRRLLQSFLAATGS